MSDFKFHKLNEQGQAVAKQIGERFEDLLMRLQDNEGDNRCMAIVRTKLEEACFFAKRAIALKKEYQDE